MIEKLSKFLLIPLASIFFAGSYLVAASSPDTFKEYYS